ncbi:hypothetical protein B9Z65_7396 [Elsinoe australis]|uniref:Uncharacterized protein n=1 Tax=Elsinoe australis TaxID=40998 RepID=A0A2P7YC05_9PEZI|nr:hypothetical protein B9Z65_7396 [Elsinoe australis]
MSPALSLFRPKSLSARLRMDSPTRVVIFGPDNGYHTQSAILFYISPNVITGYLFGKSFLDEWLELPSLRITKINVDCAYPFVYYTWFKDYIRQNADAIIFVSNAPMLNEDQDDEFLVEYMLNLEETRKSILLVL